MTNTKLFFSDLDLVRDLAFEGVRGYRKQEEVCGLLGQGKSQIELIPIENEEKENKQFHFSFNFVSCIRLLRGKKLTPLAIYHTHLFKSPNLSGSDVRVMTQTGLDMVVVSLASNEVRHYTKMQQSFPCIESTTLNLLEAVPL